MKIIQKPLPIKELSKLLYLVTKFKNNLVISNYSFLLVSLNKIDLDYDEVVDLAKFLELYSITDESIISELQEQVESQLYMLLDEIKNDFDISEYMEYFGNIEDEEPDYDYSIDEKKVKDKITSTLIDDLKGFNSKIIDNLEIDIDYIVNNEVDAEKMADDLMLEPEADEFGGSGKYSQNSDKEIEYLFERT